jgi:hypothetical protein
VAKFSEMTPASSSVSTPTGSGGGRRAEAPRRPHLSEQQALWARLGPGPFWGFRPFSHLIRPSSYKTYYRKFAVKGW